MQEEIVLAHASGVSEEAIMRIFDITHRELTEIILPY